MEDWTKGNGFEDAGEVGGGKRGLGMAIGGRMEEGGGEKRRIKKKKILRRNQITISKK